MPKPDPSIVKSAARTLEIFEYFDEVRRPAHIQDVAVALGYPHSSTGALLRSLADLGYLEFSAEDKTFFPSIRVSLLGHWVGDEILPLRRIQQQMREIAEQTQMTVVLGAASGGYCQYVRVIEGTTPIRYHVKAGTRRCLARSTLGSALLAMETPDRRAQLIAEALAVWDGDEVAPRPQDVAAEVAQVAARVGADRIQTKKQRLRRGTLRRSSPRSAPQAPSALPHPPCPPHGGPAARPPTAG